MSSVAAGRGAPVEPQAVGDPPQLSIVIVSWNSGDELLSCVRSLHDHPAAVSWEAIVVDNASGDGSIQRLRSEFPRVRVLVNPRNRGLAAANNQGIVASRAPFVLISNPDVVYAPGALDALLGLMGRRERAAFAVAKLVHPDGELQTSAGDLPSPGEALLGRRLSWRQRSAGPEGVWWHGWSHDEERQIGHGAEACYLVRRDAVAEIGLQDERFVLDWEGLDWSRRTAEAGWEIWFCPSATVTHIGGVSVRQARGRWIASTHLGMYRYLRRGVSPMLRPPLATAIAVRAVAKLLAVTLSSRVYERAQRSEG